MNALAVLLGLLVGADGGGVAGGDDLAPDKARVTWEELFGAPRVVSLHRTTCYGTCPDYSLTIHEDGRTDYSGKAYVAQTGRRRGSVRQAEVLELQALARQLAFEPGPLEVPIWESNLPWVTVCGGGMGNHQCLAYEEGDPRAPKAFFRLARRIDEVTRSGLWIRGPNDSSQPLGAPLLEAAEAVARGDVDRARKILRNTADRDAEAAFLLACAELEARHLDGAQYWASNVERLAPRYLEGSVLVNLVAERRMHPDGNWIDAFASAWRGMPSEESREDLFFQVTRLGARARTDTGLPPINTPKAFLARFASRRGRPDAELRHAVFASPTKPANWRSFPVRYVALAITNDEEDMDDASRIREKLAAQDSGDITPLLRAPWGANSPFTGEDVDRFESVANATEPSSTQADVYWTLRDALESFGQKDARLLAFVATVNARMSLAARSVAYRASATGRRATAEENRRLVDALQRLGERWLLSAGLEERAAAASCFHTAGRIANDPAFLRRGDALLAENEILMREQARALSFLGWPLKPLQDELLDGLGTDEVNTLRRLSGNTR